MELSETSTIDIPRVLNRRSLEGLRMALDELNSAVVVLRGSPDVFCEGMDLSELERPAEARVGLEEYAACLQALRTYARPVIAVAEGRTLAGGVGLVAACDLVLASEGASFGLSELLFGMMPAVVFPFLKERVSPQKARLWALGARTLGAEEACQMGLIDQVVPLGRMETTLHSWVRRLARPKPAAVEAWKSFTAGFTTAGLGAAIDAGATRMIDPAIRSAVRQFIEEGSAPWL